jgi:small subunit ribosomal protein S6
MNIDAPAAAITEMERQMRINEDVLRYLTIRVDALEEGPSAMLQSRSRDDRDGPRRGFGGREGGGFRDREGGGGGRDREGGGGYRGRDDRPPRRDFESEGRPAPEPAPAPAPAPAREGEPS